MGRCGECGEGPGNKEQCGRREGENAGEGFWTEGGRRKEEGRGEEKTGGLAGYAEGG